MRDSFASRSRSSLPRFGEPPFVKPFLTLQAIAAAVIGGTSLLGGSGTAIGLLIGAFVVAALNNGLVMMGAQATVSDIYLGAGILAAMILNVRVDRLRARRRI